MRTDRPNLPDSVRTHFTNQGYRYLDQQFPDFGGIVICLQRKDGEQEAAYYISKPSTIELVTSDELRLVLDFLGGIPLRHAVTTSPFSAGSRKLAEENGITLWELQPRYAEKALPSGDETRVKPQVLRARLRRIVL